MNDEKNIMTPVMHNADVVRQMVEKQKTTPIYLTNWTHENAHGSPELLEAMELQFSATRRNRSDEHDCQHGSDIRYDEGYEFFPLTIAENDCIGDEWFDDGTGIGRTCYSALHWGKKWLMPCIEVWFSGGDEGFQSETSVEPPVQSKDEARKAADAFANKLRPGVEAVGGHIHISCDDTEHQYVVALLLPFEHAIKLGGNEPLIQWLAALTGNSMPRAKLRGAGSVEGNAYFMVEITDSAYSPDELKEKLLSGDIYCYYGDTHLYDEDRCEVIGTIEWENETPDFVPFKVEVHEETDREDSE